MAFNLFKKQKDEPTEPELEPQQPPDFSFTAPSTEGDSESFQLKQELISSDDSTDSNPLRTAQSKIDNDIAKEKQLNKKKSSVLGLSFGKRKITKEKQTFLDNLGLLVGSGMGVNSALRTLHKNSQNRNMKKDLTLILQGVENGQALWQSLDEQEFLPKFLISLIRIGEDSGNLADKIQKTVSTLEKEEKRKAQLKTALFYPVFVLVISVVVGLGVSIFVLPRIGQVFENLDVELPWITQQMITIGNYLEGNWLWIVPVIFLGLGSIIFFGFVFPPTKSSGQWVMFRAPVFSKLIQYTEVSRFCYNLSMLINSGVPITRSLTALSEIHEYFMYKNFALMLSEEVKQGKSFHKSFKDHIRQTNALFPFTAQEIIIAGEESGNLTQVLDSVGRKFEEEGEQIAKNIAVLLEPMLLIVIWIGVVFLATAILLPIYDLVGNFEV